MAFHQTITAFRSLSIKLVFWVYTRRIAIQNPTLNVAEALDIKKANPWKMQKLENGHGKLVECQGPPAEFDAHYHFERPVKPSRRKLTQSTGMFAVCSTSCCQHNEPVNQIESLGPDFNQEEIT